MPSDTPKERAKRAKRNTGKKNRSRKVTVTISLKPKKKRKR